LIHGQLLICFLQGAAATAMPAPPVCPPVCLAEPPEPKMVAGDAWSPQQLREIEDVLRTVVREEHQNLSQVLHRWERTQCKTFEMQHKSIEKLLNERLADNYFPMEPPGFASGGEVKVNAEGKQPDVHDTVGSATSSSSHTPPAGHKPGETKGVHFPPGTHHPPNTAHWGFHFTHDHSDDPHPIRIPSGQSEDLSRIRSREMSSRRLQERLAKDKTIAERLGFHHYIPTEVPDNLLARFLCSGKFNTFIALMIITNAIYIGYETDYKLRHILKVSHVLKVEDPDWLKPWGTFFNVLFTIELAARMVAFQTWFWLGDEWKWNCFDFFIVLTSLLQEVLSTLNVSFIRMLRIARVVRVARVLRVVRIFRELRMMVISVINSMISLSWAMILLTLIIYMFSIFLMQTSLSYVDELKLAQKTDILVDLEKWFGSLWATMFSLMLAISGGADWGDMVVPLDAMSPFFRIAFLLYIVYVVFGVLNVLTGIFVSAASDISDRDLVVQAELTRRHSFIKEMKALFDELDKNQTGNFTWEEFQEYVQEENLEAYFSFHELDLTDARLLFKLLDENDTEEVKTVDFIQGCSRLKGPAKSMYVMQIVNEMGVIKNTLDMAVYGIQKQLRDLHGMIIRRPMPQYRALAAPAQPTTTLEESSTPPPSNNATSGLGIGSESTGSTLRRV